MNLLIDIGNTRLKWALHTKNIVDKSTALMHHQANFIPQLENTWQPLEKPNIVVISSVSTDSLKIKIVALLKNLWDDDIQIIIPYSTDALFGVKNSYLHPEQLGIDRWLSLIACHHHYSNAAWIVDCGTAITVDFIDKQGVHHGGLISAGLNLMKASLSKNTAALTFSEKESTLKLATQTDSAIFNGTLYAAIGLIEHVVKSRQPQAVLILTGGDAQLIASYLSFSAIVDPNLVLKGLAIFANKPL